MKIRGLKRFLALTMSFAMTLTGPAINVLAADSAQIVVEDLVADSATEAVATAEAVTDLSDVAEAKDESILKGETYNIEINQGFSKYEKKDQKEADGYYYQNDFVAGKETVIAIEVAGSTEDEVKKKIENWELAYYEVVNGEEKSEAAISWKGNEFSIVSFYDKDSNEVTGSKMATVTLATGPSKGTYTFRLKDNGTEIAKNEKVNFFETKTLNILAVPVNSYYSIGFGDSAKSNQAKTAGAYDTSSFAKWNGIDNTLKTYLKKVYPIADINIELGQSLNLGEAKYDLSDGDGPSQKLVWEECNKLQVKDKDTGKDKYDLILAFVPYRQDKGGTGQGYTFGKPTNIITLEDGDMLPTVAHEIAHCYSVGDEYDGGSYNARVNDMPLGFGKGRDKETGNDIESSDKHLADLNIATDDYHWLDSKQYKDKRAGEKVAGKEKANVQEEGKGSVVDPQLHTYDLEKKSFISFATNGDNVYPTISYMGSGWEGDDGYYYTTSVIWNHLFKQFMVKEKNTESSNNEEQSSEQSNAQILMASGATSIAAAEDEGFNLDDFYYDDNYREGSSKMVEVSGTINYAEKKTGAAVKNVTVDPMFSYDGDLSYMDFIDTEDEKTYNDSDLFYFMALDSEGKVISSPVDGKKSVFEFYGGNFNQNMSAPTPEELKKDPNADKRVQDFAAFNFEAEYPEGTKKFAIVKKADYKEDAAYTTNVLWSIDAPAKELEGNVLYADLDTDKAQVDFDVTAYNDNGEELNLEDAKDLAEFNNYYYKVYYAPLGDEGQSYFVQDGHLGDFKGDLSVKFDPKKYNNGKNDSNAYVWIKVSDGVNGTDMFSDDVDVSVTNSTVTISGGKKGTNANGFPGLKVFNYTGSEITPKVKVTVNDLESGKKLSLVEGRDYVLSYENNTNAGVATIKVKGIGEFSGTTSVFFGIATQSIKSAKLDKLPDLVYSVSTNKVNGKDKNVTEIEIESLLDATIGNTDLTAGTDYYPVYVVKEGKSWPKASEAKKTISANFAEGVDSVDVRVYLKGKNNYNDVSKKYAQFTLFKPGYELISLADVVESIDLKKDSVKYTGKRVKVGIKQITISENGASKKLSSKFYNVIYINNRNVGTATVKIEGKKGYTGVVKKTFKITPATVNNLTVSKIQNIYYTGKAISANDINVVVKAGKYTLKRGVDYTVSVNGVLDTPTTSKMKGTDKPAVTIALTGSNLPIEVKNAKAVKNFKILKGRFNSNALTSVVLDSVSVNGVQYSFSRNTEKNLFKKYAYTVSVSGNDIPATADAASVLGMKVKIAGKVISTDVYKVSITATKAGKVGKIVIEPKDEYKDRYSGKRVIKFLNVSE